MNFRTEKEIEDEKRNWDRKWNWDRKRQRKVVASPDGKCRFFEPPVRKELFSCSIFRIFQLGYYQIFQKKKKTGI
jgi:hypothetical protein